MHGNQVPVTELSFIDNYSRKKLSLNLIREAAGLQQEGYMYENCWDNKYFLINLDTKVRNNGSVTKIWLCKVMSEKRGWHVTKSPLLNPPLKGILESFTKFSGKHWCQSLFFNIVVGLDFIENDTLRQVFFCKFAKCLSVSFLQNTSRRLLLSIKTEVLCLSKGD